jgi:hypothetical protein
MFNAGVRRDTSFEERGGVSNTRFLEHSVPRVLDAAFMLFLPRCGWA